MIALLNRLHGLKMKYKVVLVLLALTTVVIASLSSMSLSAFRSAMRAEAVETSRFFSRYLEASLEGKMSRACKVAESLAATPGLASMPPDRIRAVLAQCVQLSGRIYSDLWYFGADGRCLVTVPESKTARGVGFWDMPSLARPVADMKVSGRTLVVGRFREARRGQKALLLAPVGKSGAFLSALVDFSDWRTFSRAGARSGYAALVDEQGYLVSLDPDPRGLKGSPYHVTIGGKAYPPAKVTPAIPGVEPLDAIAGMVAAVGQTPVTQETELLAIIPVPSLDFRLVVGIPESAAFHTVEQLRARIWLLTAFCWVGAALLGAAFAAGLARPLSMLRRHVDNLERGQLDEELHWVYDDEIGVLGRAINSMTRTLRKERVMKDVFGFRGEGEGEDGD